MKSILASLLVAVAACSAGPSSDPIDKSDLAGKADVDTSVVCEALALPQDCDVCKELGWYGDGMCDPFCATPDPDCAAAIPAAIGAQFAGGAVPPIHPQLGVFAIVRPGVASTAMHVASASELAAQGMVAWALEPTTCELQVGVSMLDACDEEAPRTGCYFSEGMHTPVSQTQQLLEEYDFGTVSDAEKAKATAIEAAIQFKVTVESLGAEFYYGVVDGSVYLLAIDVARLDCSA